MSGHRECFVLKLLTLLGEGLRQVWERKAAGRHGQLEGFSSWGSVLVCGRLQADSFFSFQTEP